MFSVTKTEFVAIQGSSEQAAVTYNHAHKRKGHTGKFCSKYWRWIITSREDSTKQQLLNMALLTSSAAKAAKGLQDQIFRFFQELREKQMQNQRQKLRRDHRYEVSDRSIMGNLHHLCSYLLGILN